MIIIVIGINHKTAPVSVREKVSFSPDRMNLAYDQLKELVTESLILSTCNRTEIYVAFHKNHITKKLIQWLADFHCIALELLNPYLVIYENEEAIRHIVRVSCGLDSLILGEPQILGQMKVALQTAHNNRSVGSYLNRLMQYAFSTAKKIRTQTHIGANPISVAFAAVSLAKQIFSSLQQQTALLVGAGETIELVGKHLFSHKIKNMIIANRSIEKAQKIAVDYHGVGIGLSEIAAYLPQADIVISSTAAPIPVIGKGTVEKALKIRRHRPIFMVDIAVPRDIEEEVNDLDDVYLYTVDDLQSVIEENLQSRQQAAKQAEAMVVQEISHFLDWLRAQTHTQIIRDYRQKVEKIKSTVLNKATKMLHAGKTPEDVLQFLAHTLSNKLSHDATCGISKAAKMDNTELLDAAKTLLQIKTYENFNPK